MLEQINNQQETNLHNIVFAGPQGQSLRLKHIAGLVSLAYGVILPLLPNQFVLRRLLHRFNVIQPPVWLAVPFLLTAVISFYDRPSGQEEELGEFMMSICLFVTVWLHWQLTIRAQSLEQLGSDRLTLTSPAPIYQLIGGLPAGLQRILAGLAALIVVLAGLHVVAAHGFMGGFLAWFFSMESIYGAAGLLFLLQTVLVLMLLLVMAAFTADRLRTIYTVGTIFLWIAALVYKYHFGLQAGLPYNPLTALLLCAVFILLALRFSHENYKLLLMILTGGGLLVAGYWLHIWDLRQSQMAVYFSMMLMGTLVLFTGLSVYIHQSLTVEQMTLYRRLSWGSAVLTGAGLIAILWVIPAVEARFLAQRLQVNYLDGDLSLIGYRLDDDVLQPGESTQLTLYWRVNRFLSTGYGASVNVLTQPEITSVAADNIPLLLWIDTDAWIPGMVMRQAHTIQLPSDLPVPSGLLIQNTVWWADNGELMPVSDYGAQRRLSDTAFVLERLSVSATDDLPALDIEAAVNFSDGFQLSSYQIPENASPGDTVELSFNWQSDADLQRELTQFLHIYPVDGDQYVALFDHQPLNGRFPTIDWYAGMRFQDVWEVTLPPELEPGEYILYTGMYDSQTVERVHILTQNEQVSDHRVLLGILEIR